VTCCSVVWLCVHVHAVVLLSLVDIEVLEFPVLFFIFVSLELVSLVNIVTIVQWHIYRILISHPFSVY
jgi:hypothetical protein